MEMDEPFKGGITEEQMFDDMREILNSLRNHIIETPENASIVIAALSAILEKTNPNAKEDTKFEDKEIEKRMEEKLAPYLIPNPGIIDYRNFGISCSRKSGVPLPHVLLEKARLMRWFDTNFDRLYPSMQHYEPNQENQYDTD